MDTRFTGQMSLQGRIPQIITLIITLTHGLIAQLVRASERNSVSRPRE